MRNDMKDVIIDCVRHKDRWGMSRRIKCDLEDMPVREKIRNEYNKTQSDRLSPLIKALEKHVGEYWDDVWSSICKNSDERSVRGYHLRRHVKDYVCTVILKDKNDIVFCDGAPYFVAYIPFYVDEDGILKKNPRYFDKKKTARPQKEQVKKTLDDGSIIQKISGIWYFVRCEESSVPFKTVTGKIFFKTEVKVFKVKQLSKKEMKTLGVRNG